MLGFPLGILSAAGADVEGATYELIATAFGTGSSGVISFASIPQIYKHLQLRYTAKNSSDSTQMNLTFNSVTSGIYMRHSLFGNGSSVTSGNSTANQNSIQLVESMSNSTTANAVNAGVIDILDYTSSTRNSTTVRALYGMADNVNRIYLSSGVYNESTAVTSLTLTANANNFAALSRFSLYGIRG